MTDPQNQNTTPLPPPPQSAPLPEPPPAGPPQSTSTHAEAVPSAPVPQSAPSPLPVLSPELLPLLRAGKPHTRNGKIARLPKLEREMVNRMLQNNVSQEKIVAALEERGFFVTQRNVSNWKTHGGYKEWSAQQEGALELRTFQDNLVEFLRRQDAADVPEAGLQAAATAISAGFVRPQILQDLMANPDKYEHALNLLCRINKQIQNAQASRDAAAKSLGRRFNPERLKRLEEEQVEQLRESYSYTIAPNSVNDPGVQNKNYLPKELPPAPAHDQPPLTDEIMKLQHDILLRQQQAQAATPNPQANS